MTGATRDAAPRSRRAARWRRIGVAARGASAATTEGSHYRCVIRDAPLGCRVSLHALGLVPAAVPDLSRRIRFGGRKAACVDPIREYRGAELAGLTAVQFESVFRRL